MTHVRLSSQLDVLKGHLIDLGYCGSTGKVIDNYQFAATKGQIGHADLLAFADEWRCDISTACIAVRQCSNGNDKQAMLQELSYVGAPIALFALPQSVEIWPVRADSKVECHPKEQLPYETLTEYFGRYRRELSPRALLNAKRGERQLTFFDIAPSLEAFARDATQKMLVSQFESAIQSTPQNVREKHPDAVIRLAIWTLASRILQDKLPNYKELQTRNVDALLNAAQQHFPKYFTSVRGDLKQVGLQVVEQLYEELLNGFTFRSLTNDMLAYFYENTLVDADMRKRLGIYYTPRAIAERILHRLPVETLRPEDRTVLDGTCGAGNLLLAAYNRLSGLLPARWTTEKRHDYLLTHLWGVDTDPFACEVARLSLLLYDLPIGDSWKIERGDVSQVHPQHQFGAIPNIIVGNPPFKETSSEGAKIQKAAQVLERYLDWLAPGGLLGVVLPRTFLHNTSANKTRKRLLETCDILEIGHLPEGMIPSSSVTTAVILARKLSQVRPKTVGLLTRVEEVDRGDRQRFEQYQHPTVSYEVPQEHRFHQSKEMVSSPFDRIWNKIEKQFDRIEPNFCTIRKGVDPGENARDSHFSRSNQGEGWRRVLYNNRTGKVLEPFSVNWDAQEVRYIKYPSDELERPRNPEHFDQPGKLVMPSNRNAGNPWRFYAAIDREQLVVTHNFHYVLPSETASIEELAAVFNSLIANAWYASHNYHTTIILASLKPMPFPCFSQQQRKKIRDLVGQIEKMKQSFPDTDIEALRQHIIELDEIVFDGYGLTPGERTQIRSWMNRFPRPGQEWKGVPLVRREELAPYQGRQSKLSGEVESVNTEHATISLYTQNRDDPMEIPIPPTMPGWALRPGATFLVTIPWKQRYETDLSIIRWIDFRPLDYGYLSDEELTKLLTEGRSASPYE